MCLPQDAEALANYEKLTKAFAAIYYCEELIKLSALGCVGYFSNGWCQFDFFPVCRLVP